MMTLVVGGSASGKSAYAEKLALQMPGPHYYLATMKPFGKEAERRIRRHRELRQGKGFHTLECHKGLEACCTNIQQAEGTALLECLGNAVANELFTDSGE